MYAVVFWHDRNNRIYDVLSKHRTLSGAERQFRRNTPGCSIKAGRNGMECSTAAHSRRLLNWMSTGNRNRQSIIGTEGESGKAKAPDW